MLPLFLLFIFIPAVELYFLIQAGEVIGGFNTFMLVVLTGIIGAGLAKSQGQLILMKIQKEMAEGRTPADQMIHGLLVFVGGLLLLTPGFFTDFFGLSLIFPLTRKFYINSVKRGFEAQMKSGKVKFYGSGAGFSGAWSSGSRTNPFEKNTQSQQRRVYQQNGHDVIDVEAERSDGE